MYRDHKPDVPLRNSQRPCTPIQYDFCAVRCETSSLLVCHLRSHLREGLHIECPFRGCDRRFSVLPSFASHLSKKHQDVHHVSLTNLLNTLSEKLTVLGIPEATISNIMDEMRKDDLLTACNSGPLNTDQKRKTAFKKTF